MLADEQRVVFQRRRAAVGQVVALRGGADDDELAAKIVAQAIGFAEQPPAILPEQTFNRRAQKPGSSGVSRQSTRK